ncbi:MAG TPA: glycosyltransferase family 4 protein [Dehalococcoidia bacterium]|nr:glycosyltransferase family 4 protein [Dehalococcoidia bacterium]
MTTEIGVLRVALAMEHVVGHAVYAAEMERHLASRDDLQVRAVPVTFYEENGWLERLPAVPAALRAAWRARNQVMKRLDGWDADVIFWNTQKPACLCLDVLTKCPSVISLDVTPMQYDGEIGRGYGHQPDRWGPMIAAKYWLNRRVFHQARRLLPWSNWARMSLIEDYGVSPEAIEVLSPGADLSRFYPPAHRSPAPDGKVRLLFVGGDFERKGGDTLLEWFRTSATARDCVLHVVTRAEFEAGDGVFVHRLSQDDERLPALYREADVFVLPTRAECFGIVFTEALASGIPVVSCDVGGVSEVVRDGENGLLVPAGDVQGLDHALTAIVRDQALRQRLGSRGRALAEERFDSRKNAFRVAEILREVAEKR